MRDAKTKQPKKATLEDLARQAGREARAEADERRRANYVGTLNYLETVAGADIRVLLHDLQMEPSAGWPTFLVRRRQRFTPPFSRRLVLMRNPEVGWPLAKTAFGLYLGVETVLGPMTRKGPLENRSQVLRAIEELRV